jgi:glutathione S-transferase
MARPIVCGPTPSTRLHSVRLALEEKQAEDDFVDMAPGADKQAPPLGHQPVGKVPAFEHNGFALYET